MRTTLDIADDVLSAVKDMAQREGRTAGQVISGLARRGLCAPEGPSGAHEPEAVYGLRTIASRGGLVTNEIIDSLRD